MTTYTLADPSLAAHSGRTCHLSTSTGQTWRGTFIRSIELALSNPGQYAVYLRIRGQVRRTVPLPADTVITIYPKEA